MILYDLSNTNNITYYNYDKLIFYTKNNIIVHNIHWTNNNQTNSVEVKFGKNCIGMKLEIELNNTEYTNSSCTKSHFTTFGVQRPNFIVNFAKNICNVGTNI